MIRIMDGHPQLAGPIQVLLPHRVVLRLNTNVQQPLRNPVGSSCSAIQPLSMPTPRPNGDLLIERSSSDTLPQGGHPDSAESGQTNLRSPETIGTPVATGCARRIEKWSVYASSSVTR